LTVAKITSNESQVPQFRKRIGTVQTVATDYVPSLSLEELDEVRPDEAFCAGNQCCLIQSFILCLMKRSSREQTLGVKFFAFDVLDPPRKTERV